MISYDFMWLWRLELSSLHKDSAMIPVKRKKIIHVAFYV